MGLGKEERTEPKIWLSIYNGKIVRSENGMKRHCPYVEGTLAGIYTKEETCNGGKATKWFIDLRGREGELYSFGFPYNSEAFKSIILALASHKWLCASSVVRIEPYIKGSYTGMAVWCNGIKLDWVARTLCLRSIPQIGVRRDDSKQMEPIVSQILSRLRGTADNSNKIIK